MRAFLLVALGNSVSTIDKAVHSPAVFDRYEMESGIWLIRSACVTTEQVALSLPLPDLATFLIVPIPYYYGRARSQAWKWLAQQR